MFTFNKGIPINPFKEKSRLKRDFSIKMGMTQGLQQNYNKH